ncbi:MULTISPECIES: nuclease-related domain-containing DEAD/DEAH box helicase [unclassified Moorena]|uniref:NERD domain-containing protein n=1 Tax=unclassified Moorena TaxID=2683338 RepID=UPI0013BF3BCC|nr:MULTISPECIES: nuclease-related domain-containing DEAD/DEAH box helicase [unclassified Moorena]NES44043.1 ATP-binding domain-containing protein [Moorena sp. SIO2C4]NET68397.1 ATP-binding domain-containing protein [Moorena sp. SIO1G6]
MEFISTKNFDSEAEKNVWNAIKRQFNEQPGYCWHRYPITSYSGPRLEPDIIIIHPEWGLIIIEVKGCYLEDIEAIEGHTWYMQDWYKDEIEPYDQAQKHMWAILDRLKQFNHGFLRNEQGNCKIAGKAFVALPYVSEPLWKKRFQEHLSAPKWELIFSGDLEDDQLYQRIINSPIKQKYPFQEDSEEWKTAIAVITGSQGIQSKKRRPTKKQDSKAAFLRKVEEKIKTFDSQQHKVAVQTPAGPQRIRGLAGTGKTVVLAQKAAYMHVQNPDWSIVYTFYSRSLYEQIINYITRFVQEFSRGELEEPNRDKIHILHAWGGSEQSGLYQQVTATMNTAFRNFNNARSYFGTSSGRFAFNGCCGELLEHENEIPEFFDAILIDEAQDLGENYFRLCYELLKQPKRIIWGYDEVQSLEELEIPTAESLFGKDIDGNPLVSLDGVYPGEIEKDMILYHCYRNPRPVLIAAHAFGLGLRRRGGAVQFINTVGGWQDIGYEVEQVNSNELITGQEITLHRPKSNSPHLLEELVGYHNLIQYQNFENRYQELEWIINDIEKNIKEEELKPDEIAIIALDSRKKIADQEYEYLYKGLENKKIQSVRIGTDTSADIFRSQGCVTITSVFRAKGNEASVVYVYGFENIAKSTDIVKQRNIAFTAMTRTKGWLTITGVGEESKLLFREIQGILEEIGRVKFIVPDMNKIQRNLETYENQRRRKRTQKAQKSLVQLLKDRADVNPEDLPLDQRKKLLKWLLSNNKDIDDLLSDK